MYDRSKNDALVMEMTAQCTMALPTQPYAQPYDPLMRPTQPYVSQQQPKQIPGSTVPLPTEKQDRFLQKDDGST
jgi:hypothetical protein